MAKINTFRVDSDKVLNGVWIDFELDVKLKIARMNNSKYDAELRKLSRPHMKKIRSRFDLPDDLQEEISMEAASKYILLDWKNIEDNEGKPIPYSSEKALEFFKDPELRDLYKFVMIQSNVEENYRKEIVEDSAKN